jgi:hypothetical protein
MRQYAENQLGFAMPNFRSSAEGSGARFAAWRGQVRGVPAPATMGRTLPHRSRLVRMRGLGDYDQVFDDGSIITYNDAGGVVAVTDSGANTTYIPSSGGGSSGGTPVRVTTTDGGTSWVNSSVIKDITALIQAGQQAVAQQRIIDINMQRARQGLPLIDPRNFSPSAAVNFGLTPQASQMLLIGGIALAAVMFLGRSRK